MIGEIGNFKMKKLLLILLCLPMIGFGQCVSGDCENGQGTYIYGTTQEYEGEWKDGLRHGFGKNTFPNGTVKEGLWENDILIEDLSSPYNRNIENLIKEFVEKRVNEWQQKGEFEKTNDYLLRVNEKNRTVKIKEFQEVAMESLKLDFLNSIDFSNIELGDYDADNETFLLKVTSAEVRNIFNNSTKTKSVNLGGFDFVLSVPINEAKEFKKSFSSYKFLNPECEIIDNKLCLSYVEVTEKEINSVSYTFINGKSQKNEILKTNQLKVYTYNLSNTQDYSITEIDYEFSAIEIDDIKSSKTTKSSRISTNKLKVGESSVNINIPTNKKVKNRYALVIGNEDYTSFQRTLSSEQNVDYAVNDASTFKKYCLKTLGVKEDNMFFLTNATAGTMHQEIDLITKIINKVGRKAELIVYYAGHGYPDELTKVPYLIPVDVSASNLSTAIKLDDLYQKLANTNASKITIFLDACFTGGGRNSGLVASRGVKVKPKEGVLDGNIVVFSASSAEESSLPYHHEGHGVFTYFLLKKFQESEGNVTLGELSEYLDENVSIKSLRVNQKEQNPTVNTSSKVVNDWRNWKF